METIAKWGIELIAYKQEKKLDNLSQGLLYLKIV